MLIKRGIQRLLDSTPFGVFETFTLPANSNMAFRGSPQSPNVDPITEASAIAMAIYYGITKVSGTAEMTTIAVPAGFRGTICLIPTGAFTGATGGTAAYDGTSDAIPIGKAFTAVAAKALYLTTDGLLWYPSY